MKLYTRADVVADVQTLLDDDQYSADTITTAANWFQDEITTAYRLRFMEASDELSASQGDTEMELPDDILTIIEDGFYLTSPQTYNMMAHYISYRDFMRSYANFASATEGQASTWTDFGNMVRFARPLNADHTFQMDYLREATDVAEDEDAFEIPGRYREMIAKGTLSRVMEINEDYAEASQERKNMEPLITTFVRNEGRGQIKTGPIVIGPKMRGRIGGRPGVNRDY